MTAANPVEVAREAVALSEKATPGPWACQDQSARHKRRGPVFILGGERIVTKVASMTCNGAYRSEDDPDFIAHARTSLPLLAREVLRLTEENAALRAAAQEYLDSRPTEYLDVIGPELTRISVAERALRAALPPPAGAESDPEC